MHRYRHGRSESSEVTCLDGFNQGIPLVPPESSPLPPALVVAQLPRQHLLLQQLLHQVFRTKSVARI